MSSGECVVEIVTGSVCMNVCSHGEKEKTIPFKKGSESIVFQWLSGLKGF